MEVITAIQIESVETVLNEDGKSVSVTVVWSTSPNRYEGELDIVITKGNVALDSKKTVDAGIFTFSKVELSEESENAVKNGSADAYEVYVSASGGESPVASKRVRILTKGYTYLGSCYDNARWQLRLEEPGSDILFGTAEIDNGENLHICRLNQYETTLEVDYEKDSYDLEQEMKVTFTAWYDEVSSYLDRKVYTVWMKPVKLLSVDRITETDRGVEIACNLSMAAIGEKTPGLTGTVYQGEKAAAVCTMKLEEGKRETFGGQLEDAETVFSGSLLVPAGLFLDISLLYLCRLSVGAGDDLLMCRVRREETELPLGCPVIQQMEYDGADLSIRFGLLGDSAPGLYKAAYNGQTIYTNRTLLTLYKGFEEAAKKEAVLRPVWDGREGCPLKIHCEQVPCYQCSIRQGMTILSLNVQTGDQIQVKLPDPLFVSALEKAIGNDVLSLVEKEGEYTLSVAADPDKVTRQKYDGFLTAILTDAAKVRDEGFYQLLDCLARILPGSLEDSLYYFCGLSPDGRRVDLRPGYLLAAYGQQYQFQPDDKSPALSGFAMQTCQEYPIHGFYQGGEYYLGFDQFLAQYAGHVDVPSLLPAGNGGQQGAGGMVDAFSSGFRNTYYRLVLPSLLLDGAGRGSGQVMDHQRIVACPSYADFEDSEAMSEASVLYLRGRGSFGLRMQVMVNNSILTVDVGTTLGQIGERFGFVLDSQIRMYRNTGRGILAKGSAGESFDGYLPVSFRGGKLSLLVLAPGDRIYIGRNEKAVWKNRS